MSVAGVLVGNTWCIEHLATLRTPYHTILHHTRGQADAKRAFFSKMPRWAHTTLYTQRNSYCTMPITPHFSDVGARMNALPGGRAADGGVRGKHPSGADGGAGAMR